MDQWLIILLGALAVAAIVVGVASAYTMSTVAKMPEQGEIVHLVLAGSIVGGTLSWLISSGYLHGHSMASMIVSDVKSLAKDVGLKGGEESIAAPVSTLSDSEGSSMTQMVGGFLNSMGINSSSLPQLTVGMPTF